MKKAHMKNPPHPGLGVRVDCLEPYNLSITEGAKILGVSRQALSMLINKKTDLSWDMAIRISKAFGGTLDGITVSVRCSASRGARQTDQSKTL